jgi:D-alanyl-D-alanine carboxypeptidase/D-alanyl-D-alanine-endopeptidase (penicillin-binding protein 4)
LLGPTLTVDHWRRAGASAVACAILLSPACRSISPRVAPASAPPAHPARPAPPAQLQRDIDAILAKPELERGYWGVLVKSLKTGETLYALNERKLMMPASNMKIVTLAAAIDRLGWDYTYATRFLAAGSIQAGSLQGDVIVVGSGDPSFGSGGSADAALDACAEKLKGLGVRTIAGRIIGDDNAFDDDGLGFGWSWDDLPDDYAAAVGALQFNENSARLTVAPGLAVGDVAAIGIEPPGAGLTIDNHLQTGGEGSPLTIEARRLPGSSRLELRGSMPLGSLAVSRIVSVENPTQFVVNTVRRGLIARGIDVRGDAIDIDDIADRLPRDHAIELFVHRSQPLSALAVRLMKASQNLYAETLLKTIGSANGAATALAGRGAAEAALQRWGVAADGMILRDGSGLSRYDYVTPETLVVILSHVAADERLRGPFEASLPVAGRDGTLANQFKGTPADGRVRAKTGSMANVRSLAGYATTAAGEPLVFSIIANNFSAAPPVIVAAVDEIVVRIVEDVRR